MPSRQQQSWLLGWMSVRQFLPNKCRLVRISLKKWYFSLHWPPVGSPFASECTSLLCRQTKKLPNCAPRVLLHAASKVKSFIILLQLLVPSSQTFSWGIKFPKFPPSLDSSSERFPFPTLIATRGGGCLLRRKQANNFQRERKMIHFDSRAIPVLLSFLEAPTEAFQSRVLMFELNEWRRHFEDLNLILFSDAFDWPCSGAASGWSLSATNQRSLQLNESKSTIKSSGRLNKRRLLADLYQHITSIELTKIGNNFHFGR